MSDTPGASTLTDDLADAEQRARDAVMNAVARSEQHIRDPMDDEFTATALWDRFRDALSRYVAVCRLAGRWEGHVCYEDCGTNEKIRAELARLMADCP